jgi:hypothetical protein
MLKEIGPLTLTFNPPNKKIRSNFRTEEKISRFSWRGASCGSIVVSSVLRSQLLADLRAATGRTQIPPVIGLIGVFGAIRVFPIVFGRRAQKRPRSLRTRDTEWSRGARLPPRTYTRPVVPPPCRGPAAVALRAVSQPFLARVPGREVAGVRVISVFPFFLGRWAQKRSRSP